MDVVLEVLREAVQEIVDKPGTYAIEVVQFGILVMIVKMVAFGSKTRRGMVVNMLAERRERIAARLAEAEAGRTALAAAHEETARIAAVGDVQVATIMRDARKQAKTQRLAILADGAEQATAVIDAARWALEREQAEMLQGIRDQLVEIVTQATQQVLEQGFSPTEQRAIVQKAIVSGIEELESVSVT